MADYKNQLEDLLLEAVKQDASDLHLVGEELPMIRVEGQLKELDEKFSQYISVRETTISLGVPHWRKEYLLNNKEPHKVVFQGGQSGNYKIDKIDEEILKLLINNARMPITEIAQRLKTTPRIINYRIKNLKKDKIILINRIFLDFNKFNWIYCKALLKFKSLTNQKYNQFFQ